MSDPESSIHSPRPEVRHRSARASTVSRMSVPATLWACASLVCVGLLLVSLIQRYGELRHPSLALRTALSRLGMAPSFYVAYNLTLEAAVALVFIGVALVIAWSRPRSRPALLIALILVAFGAAMPGTIYSVVIQQPIWTLRFGVIQAIGWSLLLLFPYVFPDGRVVPRRMRPVAVLSAIWAVCFFLFAGALGATRQQVLVAGLIGWGICFALGALAQIYRYRFVSTAVERQQTKWVVLGFVAALAGTCVAVTYHVATLVTAPVGPVLDLPLRLAAATLLTISVALIPLAVGVAILQYRLFDIDVLIHRTLVYGVLTALLGATYFVVVGLLELGTSLFAGRGSDVAIVLSTLLIAALFQPWRRRVQAVIDRRFYRAKYDAQRAIAAFGETLRSELDPDQVSDRLLTLVDETMRPRTVSLWGVRRSASIQIQTTPASEPEPLAAPHPLME
jgi:hypothetical protein